MDEIVKLITTSEEFNDVPRRLVTHYIKTNNFEMVKQIHHYVSNELLLKLAILNERMNIIMWKLNKEKQLTMRQLYFHFNQIVDNFRDIESVKIIFNLLRMNKYEINYNKLLFSLAIFKNLPLTTIEWFLKSSEIDYESILLDISLHVYDKIIYFEYFYHKSSKSQKLRDRCFNNADFSYNRKIMYYLFGLGVSKSVIEDAILRRKYNSINKELQEFYYHIGKKVCPESVDDNWGINVIKSKLKYFCLIEELTPELEQFDMFERNVLDIEIYKYLFYV